MENKGFSISRKANPSTYFALTFSKTNQIILLFADKQVISAVKRAAIVSWSQSELKKRSKHFYIISFHGSSSFSSSNSVELTLESQRLCCRILSELKELGWRLILSNNLSETTELMTWFFRKEIDMKHKHQSGKIFSLNFCDNNIVQLINAPLAIRRIFQRTVVTTYEAGVKSEHFYGKDYQLCLKKSEVHATTEKLYIRKLLLELFRQFDQEHYQFYGTVNLNGGADSLFFIHVQSVTYNNKYMMMNLLQDDRILMIDSPTEVLDLLRSTIFRCWKNGIQMQNNFHMSWEFKLYGTPWLATTEEDRAKSQFFIIHIFESLLAEGVHVAACFNILRRTNSSESIFILKTCRPTMESFHFGINFKDVSKIRLINCDYEMKEKIRNVIVHLSPWSLRRETSNFGCHEFNVVSNSFFKRIKKEENLLFAQKLTCFSLKVLTQLGWNITCVVGILSDNCTNSTESLNGGRFQNNGTLLLFRTDAS